MKDLVKRLQSDVFQKVCQASLTDDILSDDAGQDSTAAQNVIRR